FEPPLLRRARRLRRATHLRLYARLLDEIRQPFHRIALVVFLRAKALRADDDHVVVGEASAGECAQPLSHAFRQCRPELEVAAQLHGARDFVDVLAARSARANEAQLDGCVRNVGHGHTSRAIGLRSLMCTETSRCATGILILCSWNRRQIARLTSERTLFTPSCGSEIQKRSSRS